MRLALLGFGLIGGSIARALREREAAWRIVAWSPSGGGPARAAAEGTIERAATSPDAAVEEADLVVLAAPPLACLALLDRLAALSLPEGAVVTDVASTKRQIAEHAAGLGLRFVGGHPMAGLETAGYGASDPHLFVDRPWVVCGDGEDAETVERLARATGARPIRMTPAAHDAAAAAVSHLPLVLSAALVEAITADAADWAVARQLAAGGWASMTRLARGDVEMGAGILATNGDEVAQRLRILRDALDGWLTELDEGDADALRERLAAARDSVAGT